VRFFLIGFHVISPSCLDFAAGHTTPCPAPDRVQGQWPFGSQGGCQTAGRVSSGKLDLADRACDGKRVSRRFASLKTLTFQGVSLALRVLAREIR
jgi:hypothetical protein